MEASIVNAMLRRALFEGAMINQEYFTFVNPNRKLSSCTRITLAFIYGETSIGYEERSRASHTFIVMHD